MYLKIKNAIIALLLTVMYLGWMIQGLSEVKCALACVCMFVSVYGLLETTDERYRKARKKSA